MCLHYLVKLIARVLSPYLTYCSKEVTPDFIPPSLWPPNSPDLNRVDYAIWGIMQERVYNKGKIANVEELRQRIVDEWERLDQRIIDGAVKEWRKRLWARAAAKGGQFEHELWLVVQQCCCNCALWLCLLIVWLLIKYAVTVFSVLWLFQSHAAIVKRYNAFCVKLAANSDIEQSNISKSTFSVHVSEHFHIKWIVERNFLSQNKACL